MLQDIREKAQGWIAWTIVILISIPFALWGINSYFGNGASVPVLVVNGQEVSRAEFQQTFQQQRRQLQQVLGDQLRTGAVSDEMIQNSVIEGMIRNQLLLQAATDAGMRIGDAALAQRIHSMPEFRDGNGFSKSMYESRLYGSGYTPAGFEANLRTSMMLEQLQQGVSATDFTTPAELDTYLRLREQRRTTGYLEIPTARFDSKVQISDADVEQYYNAHKEAFITPEQLRLNYIELTADALASKAEVTDEEARAYYEEHIDRYQTEERRHAAHILITADPKDETAMAAARSKIEKLRAEIEAGADFADVAKKNSQDPGSAAEGGDLGFFGRGIMDPAFEAATFTLKPGELSQPVDSAFGVHLIKLIAVEGGVTKPYEEVAAEVKAELAKQKVDSQFYEKAETLANLTYEHPDSLQPAADALGIPVETTEWFGRDGGKGVAAEPRVLEAVFADDVLNGGNNSEVLELGTNHYVVVRVEDHRVPAPKSLDDVREEIRGLLKHQETTRLARELGERLTTALRGGEKPETLAESEGLTWHAPIPLDREDPAVPSAIARTAFTLPKPEADKPAIAGVELAGGDYAVVMLTAVEEGRPDKVSDAQRRAFATTLARGNGRNDFQFFGESLRGRAEVEIHRDNL